ncbi:mitochondrial import inner membrane translocase subunit Tim29 [Nomia melanderi]|uniref:mitochondrial import inner membrane translocase subunit Tim29 n=1 Tax=Nomia melanderi TaxID=2448451 RepID=UPI0013042F75|nr:mitochondrial import inner membrane translocase subunit Tim29 [Nomia melanderi]XP_031844903.1 mitochondrial import inner membrane translocase subunit Tim29 [Nomia melanderi]XP_031844904.1 mitochondrial import inner membrane translocase subunit Tim29 [Nomia melanderi]
MSYGQLTRFRNYKFSTKLKNSIINISNKIENFETPERLKGTFLERWGRYWKNVYLDYKGVAEDIVKECKERPIKVSTYTALTAFCVYLNKYNPDECSFREYLLQNSMKLMQVAEPLRNPISENHVKWLEQCYNEGVIRRLNLGIISIIWIDNYDKVCSLYKAVCPYLRPRYITFHERIVDIGCLDKWWILENKMKNYDVNEAEFSNIKEE